MNLNCDFDWPNAHVHRVHVWAFCKRYIWSFLTEAMARAAENDCRGAGGFGTCRAKDLELAQARVT